MSKYKLALGQGTTSSGAIIGGNAGKIVSVAQKEFTQIYPKAGWVEPVSYTHLTLPTIYSV